MGSRISTEMALTDADNENALRPKLASDVFYIYCHAIDEVFPPWRTGHGLVVRTLSIVGILQNMVNPSLAPTQPEGSELPIFSYGGEGIPRVLKHYRYSPHGYIFPIRWSNQLIQSERLIYAPLA